MRALPPDEVHVWLRRPAETSDADLARHRGWMTAAELEREARFAFDHLKRDHAVTRGLVRSTLSLYAPVSPADWRFTSNQYGRPEILAPDPGLPLHFNLSHTSGLIACAVAARYGVGVDVEDLTRHGETIGIADRYFSPDEVRELKRRPPEAQRDGFFEYWTLKEAYIKARGMGLHLPLDQFTFHLEPGRAIGISFGPGIDDDPARWQFTMLRPTPTHQLAVAIDRGAHRDIQLRVE